MEVHKFKIQLFRYGTIGIINNSVGYLVYLLFTYVGLCPKLAMSFLYLIGTIISFFGNKTWAFSYKGNLFNTGIRYVIAQALGYFLNLIILVVMVDRLGYSHQWIQALAIFIVAGFLFLLHKFFVFKQ